MPVKWPTGRLVGTGNDRIADIDVAMDFTTQSAGGIGIPRLTEGRIWYDGLDLFLRDDGGADFLLGGGSGGAAPLDGAYVMIGNNATLTGERALTGTANQVIILDNGVDATVVLSTPQNIHIAATPTFGGLFLNGVLDMEANDIIDVEDLFAISSITVGDEVANDSLVRWYSATVLKYQWYWDESLAEMILAEDVTDDTKALLNFSTSEIIVNKSGRDFDFKVVTTGADILLTDAVNDRVYLGDGGVTNYVQVEADGDLTFVGGGGLAFAEIYVEGSSATISLDADLPDVIVTQFTTNGQSNNCTPVVASNKITIDVVGRYHVMVSVGASIDTGASTMLMISAYLNGVQQLQIKTTRALASSAGEGSMSLSGIIDVTIAGWDLDLRANVSDTTSRDVTFIDVNMSVVQIGGT